MKPFGRVRIRNNIRVSIPAGQGESSRACPVKTKTHFAFRVDIWDETGTSIVEHVAGVDDFEVADATLPGSRGALAEGADHAAAGRTGRA
jgi:hypothetical protein